MVEKIFGTLGSLKVPVLVYESYDESDKAAGVALATLNSANDNFHYRGGPAADTREWICDMLEKDTGIERKTKPVNGKDGQPKKDDKGVAILDWDESEGEYVRRVMAEKDWKDLTSFQDALNTWAKTAEDGKPLAVNAKAAERTPKAPPKLAAKYKLAAAKAITLGTVTAINSNQLSKISKTFTATGDTSKTYIGTFADKTGKDVSFTVSDKDAEALGWLLREYMDWKAQQEMDELVSA